MKILVNSEPRDVAAATLGEALSELGFLDKGVATALNGTFVSREVRASTLVNDGDCLEVLAPMQGG